MVFSGTGMHALRTEADEIQKEVITTKTFVGESTVDAMNLINSPNDDINITT